MSSALFSIGIQAPSPFLIDSICSRGSVRGDRFLGRNVFGDAVLVRPVLAGDVVADQHPFIQVLQVNADRITAVGAL